MSFYNNVWCGQCNIIDHALAKRSKSLASLNKLYGELYCRRLLKHSERYQVTQCFLSERSSDHDEVHPAKSSNGLCSQHLCQVNFLEWMADWAKVLLAHHNENSLLRSFSPNFLIFFSSSGTSSKTSSTSSASCKFSGWRCARRLKRPSWRFLMLVITAPMFSYWFWVRWEIQRVFWQPVH